MPAYKVWVSSKASPDFVQGVKKAVFEACAVDGRYLPPSVVGTVGAPLGPHGVAVVRGSEEHRALRAAGFSVIPVRAGRSVQQAVEKALSERARAVALLTPPSSAQRPTDTPPPEPREGASPALPSAPADDAVEERPAGWKRAHDAIHTRAVAFVLGLMLGLALGSC